MRALSAPLAAQYPGGDAWLRRRLADAEHGRARCHLQWDGGSVAGVAIETPKGPGRLKLSTLWIAPGARGRGLGRVLVDHCAKGWRRDGIDRVHVTVGEDALPEIAGVLRPHGFALVAREPDRYGPGRDESVLVWTA